MQINLEEIIIREIRKEDVEELVNKRIIYLLEMQGPRDETYINKLRIDLKDFFISNIQTGAFVCMVAIIKENVLAYGAMLIKNVPGDMNSTLYKEADIFNMYTIPEARKMGISKMILQKLIEKSKEQYIAKLSLHTSMDGEKLYRSFGFSEPVFPYLELAIV
jgi:ribosomal protein S18 acetylase RimI-like enzyme